MHRRRTRPLAAALAAVLLASAAAPSTAYAAKGDLLWTLSDPRGDDNGDGTLRYPLRYYGLAQGDLDLLSLTARRVDGGTELEATFANPIRPTERRTIDIGGTNLDQVARFGFYTTNVDIYIDTDRVAGSGALETLPGRVAAVAPAFAWEKAIALTPRPFEARTRLKDILLKSLKAELRDEQGRVDPEQAERIKAALPADVESHIYFPNRIRTAGRSIRFTVPDSFLGGPALATWGYVVVVTGADIDLRFDAAPIAGGLTRKVKDNLMVLPISPGGREDHFGGAQEADALQPPIIDLIAPPGFTQQRILRDYDLRTDRPVELPGVVPAEVKGK
jgi:C-terminal binding-module, SLH-like, of glucodextranase